MHFSDEEAALHEDVGTKSTETTALLAPSGPSDPESEEDISSKWEEAVLKGHIKTTWKREARVLAGYTAPLMLTFFLPFMPLTNPSSIPMTVR